MGWPTRVVVANETRLLRGLEWEWASAASITVQPGVARDAADVFTMELAAEATADITASGALGLDTGSEASSTWYYVYLISGVVGVSVILSASSTSPTLPSGYTRYRRLGSIYNDSSSDLRDLVCKPATGRHTRRNSRVLFNDGLTGTGLKEITLGSYIPPEAKVATIRLRYHRSTNANANCAFFTDGGTVAVEYGETHPSWDKNMVVLDIPFGSPQQLHYQATASGALTVVFGGWEERL